MCGGELGRAGTAWPRSTEWVRATRSAISAAFHSPQAAGPVASASASVSACSRSSISGVPTAAATAATVAGSSRSRRVAVSGSSRWWRTRVTRMSVSAGSKPSRGARSATTATPASVWSPGQPLPMSCSSAPTSSRSGRSTRRVKAAALDGGLDEVAVDGEPVDRVALRPAADPLPVRAAAGREAGLVERLPHRDGRDGRHRAGRRGRRGRRTATARAAARSRPPAGRRCAARAAARPARRRPRRAARGRVVRRAGVAGEHDLAVLLDDAVGQRSARSRSVRERRVTRPTAAAGRARRARPGARSRRARTRPSGRPRRPGAAAASSSSRPSRCATASCSCRTSRSVGATGHVVQGVADVEQRLVRLLEAGVRGVGDPGRGDGAQHDEVAQAAARLLEVGLEREGQLAGSLGPLRAGGEQLGEPALGEAAPVGEHAARSASAEADVAGDVPDVEQAEEGPEVVGGDAARLGRSAHGVVEPDPGVPDRVPDPVGELGRLRSAWPRRGRPADSRGRCPARAPGGRTRRRRPARPRSRDRRRPSKSAGEPGVGEIGQCPPPARPGQPGAGQQL